MKFILKDHALSIKEFGLGFIQIKLDEAISLNVYTDKVKKFINYNSPHNHQRNFKSYILNGLLLERIYDVSLNENGQSAFCGCGDIDDVINEKYEVSSGHQMIYNKGDVYRRDKELYHTVEASDGTITLIVKDMSSKHNALVIGEKSVNLNYIFTENQLWDIVENYINDDILNMITKLQE